MAVFRVEKNSGYTVMSNHHLRNRALSLKAKGLLSQMLSLPEDWDYTLQGLARINRESIDAIRQAIRELEQAGYIQRSRERDEKGRLRGADYVIFELPQPVPASVSPTLENPTLENVLQTFCTITRTKLSIRAVITPIIRFTIMPFIAIFKDSINNHDITSFYPKSNSPGLKNNLY